MAAENGWPSLTIQSLIDAGVITAHKDGNYGSNYPRKHEFGEQGVPLLTAKLLDDGGRIDFRSAPRLAHEKADKLTYGFIETNDVLLSHNATIGRVAVVPELTERILVGTSLTYYRVDSERLSPRYLAAFFSGRAFQNQLIAVMSHSTRNQVPITTQRGLSIVVPPITIQNAVADILAAFDDKIELNRRMNETLEAMARAIFKSWFVDFDPVRAKLDGRQPTGLDPQTATLFPSSFDHIDGELVPSGWSLSPLPDAIEVNPKRTLKKGDFVPYLDMKNMPTKGHCPESWRLREFKSGTRFMNGDTLLARITPCLENGKTAFVDTLADGEIAWGSTEYIVLCPNPPLPGEYGYYLARSDELRLFAIQNMTGSSGRQRVPADCFEQFLICVPPAAIAQRFGEIVGPLMQQVTKNCQQSESLLETRDALLPKLLSGELRVSHAELIAVEQ